MPFTDEQPNPRRRSLGIQDRRVNQPYFFNPQSFERLYLQTIPPELDYNPEGTWVSIHGPGRNNPLYHYTGSEDTLAFSLTWYCNHQEDRKDVVEKCKWLEALSKNNGYDAPPPAIKFVWGSLFKEAYWILFAAGYKLSLPNREKGGLFQLATQNIVLKRVTTENLKWSDIKKL